MPLFQNSPGAKPFIWKRVWFACEWTCTGDTFLFEWFRTKTSFDTKDNLGNGRLPRSGLDWTKTFQEVLRNKRIICSSKKSKIIAVVVAVIVIAIIIAVVLVLVLKKKEEKEEKEGKSEFSIPPLPTAGEQFYLSESQCFKQSNHPFILPSFLLSFVHLLLPSLVSSSLRLSSVVRSFARSLPHSLAP